MLKYFINGSKKNDGIVALYQGVPMHKMYIFLVEISAFLTVNISLSEIVFCSFQSERYVLYNRQEICYSIE